MSFIPEDQMKPKLGLNLAPMIDFVFLMLAFFASLTITKITLKDTGISLVKVGATQELSKEKQDDIEKVISISISKDGSYKWITEYHELLIKDAEQIGLELARQYELGALPQEKAKTQVLLQIDEQAKWAPISQVIFSIRDQGFEVHPIYQPDFAH